MHHTAKDILVSLIDMGNALAKLKNSLRSRVANFKSVIDQVMRSDLMRGSRNCLALLVIPIIHIG